MSWWHRNTMRMIQFNLQAEDAAVDAQELVSWLKSMNANAVMIGAGGITAYYPTQLPYHYRSPWLGDNDMLGKVIELCHQNQIKVIARFDFSKLHESIALKHPEWLYKDCNGDIVNYHGMVHTCLSGEYQWKHSLDILKECLTKYHPDGIYINMFGYMTFDYDGVNHGICHCENCRRQYENETGRVYPVEGDARNPTAQKLDPANDELNALSAWQETRSSLMTQRVMQLVHEIDPQISVCTHTNEPLVNMTHTESNTALSRPLPLWIYPSFDNVRLTNDKHNGILSANCCINAADIAWRFTGISSAFNRAKMWQQLAAGGQLEWCIVGTPKRYPDKTNFDGVKDIFAFHKKNEQYYGRNTSLAKIAVVRSNESFPVEDGRMDEYRGVVRALKQGHYIFDIITEENVKAQAENYDLLILPDSHISTEDIPTNCNIIMTGMSLHNNTEAAQKLFDATFVRTVEKNLGAYLYNDDKQTFKRMPLRDWLLLTDQIDLYSGKGYLPYMAPGIFGPVEIAGGVFPSEFKSILVKEENGIRRILVPWWIGRLYTRFGYEDHRNVLLDLVDSILEHQDFQTNAPVQVDAYYDAIPDGRMVHFVNLTGFNGVSVHEHIPVHDIQVTIPKGNIKCVTELYSNEQLSWEYEGDRVKITLPVLHDFAAILLQE